MKKISELELALVSLLILSLLLPVGILSSVTSPLFFGIFSIHLILLVGASFLAIKFIFSLIKTSSHLTSLFFGLSVFIIVAASVTSIILPVTARDALIHHLAIPKLWIEQSSIFPTLWHEWSFYPMLIQLSFTAILQLGIEQLTAFYILLFLPLVLSTTAKLAELLDKTNRDVGLLSCSLMVLTPVVIKLSGIPLVDLPLIFLCGAGLYFLFKMQESFKVSRYAYYAGMAWGLALSCKLNAIPAFALALLFFASTSFRLEANKTLILKNFVIVILLAIACYSPWLIRNSLWTSNPLYPYFSSVFGQHLPKYNSGLAGLNPLQQRLLLYGESITEVIFLPIRIFFGGEDDNPRNFDGILSPLLLLGIFFGILNINKEKHRTLTLFSIAFILLALLSTGARVRYLAPTLIALASLGAAALVMLESKGRIGRWLAWLIVTSQIIASSIYAIKNYPFSHALAFAQGTSSKADYLNSKVPEYPIISFCNTNLPPDARISLVYTGNQFYLYDRATFSAGHTSADQIIAWLKAANTSIDLLTSISGYGLTHLIINDDRLFRTLDSTLSPNQKEIWVEFIRNHLRLLFSERGFSVYQIQ